jgi:CO/xanthine dehydrogenase FAD-binding subunit
MKPVPFSYCRPDSIDEALSVLCDGTPDTKILAGGQSLVPMLNFRVVRPQRIVDIQRLLELDSIRAQPDGGLLIGALTRHRSLETSSVVEDRFPVIPEAMRHVAHLAIRNRGTLGGSLCHSDPAAELPMLIRLLDGQIVVRSERGERRIAAVNFFTGPLSTAIAEDELLVHVELPGLLPGAGWGFEEFARRAGDYALAAVGVVLEPTDGRVVRARIAMMGVADLPLRFDGAEAQLVGLPTGEVIPADLLRSIVSEICDDLPARNDLAASMMFRRHLARGLLERQLVTAWRRLQETVR